MLNKGDCIDEELKDGCISQYKRRIFSVNIVKAYNWISTIVKDITIPLNISVRDSYSGLKLKQQVKKTYINNDCKITNCVFCHGKGTIDKEEYVVNSNSHITVTYPCPRCIGMGYISDSNCYPYTIIDEVFSFQLPMGLKRGYKQIYHGLGNTIINDELLPNFSVIKGDIVIVIENIIPDLKNNILIKDDNNVELKLYMTPREGIHGFEHKISYFNDKVLFINRSSKITLPDTSITIENIGFPINTNQLLDIKDVNNVNFSQDNIKFSNLTVRFILIDWNSMKNKLIVNSFMVNSDNHSNNRLLGYNLTEYLEKEEKDYIMKKTFLLYLKESNKRYSKYC